MDVLDFFSEFRRMCKSSSDCTKCQYHGDECDNAIELLEKTVAVVEKWSQEHPRKTRQSVFLKQWPEAMIDKTTGVLTICPAELTKECRDDRGACMAYSIETCVCESCRRDFWMQEVE